MSANKEDLEQADRDLLDLEVKAARYRIQALEQRVSSIEMRLDRHEGELERQDRDQRNIKIDQHAMTRDLADLRRITSALDAALRRDDELAAAAAGGRDERI